MKYLSGLAKRHTGPFSDPKFIDDLINIINRKFGFNPSAIAEELDTEGAIRWANSIKPKRLELWQAATSGNLEQVKNLSKNIFIQTALQVY